MRGPCTRRKDTPMTKKTDTRPTLQRALANAHGVAPEQVRTYEGAWIDTETDLIIYAVDLKTHTVCFSAMLNTDTYAVSNIKPNNTYGTYDTQAIVRTCL